jgi:hypothetical protein
VDWRAYAAQFDRLAQRYGWPEEERLEQLVSLLRENALAFYAKLPAAVQEDYHALTERMMNRFGRREPATSFRRQLQELKQKTEEPLEEYAERAQQLALDGYPGANVEMVNTLAADAFLKGCSNKQAAYSSMLQRPDTIDEALEWVRESTHSHQALFGTEKKVRQTSWADDDDEDSTLRQITTSSGTSDLVKTLRDEFRKLGERTTSSLEEFRKMGERTTSSLEEFRKMGEKTNSSLEEVRRMISRRPRSPSPGQNSDACFGCGKPGHFKRDCPSASTSFGEKSKVQFNLTGPQRSRSPSPATMRDQHSPVPRSLNARGSGTTADRS